MAASEAVMQAVSEYLHQHRYQRDRPPRRMARDLLKLIEAVETGTYVEPTPEEIRRRNVDAMQQRWRNSDRQNGNGNREATR